MNLSKSVVDDDGGDVEAGDTLTYTFVVEKHRQTSPSPASTWTDPLPGLGAIACTFPGADGELAPTETATCTATYTVTQADVDGAEVDNTATVTAQPPTPLGGQPSRRRSPTPTTPQINPQQSQSITLDKAFTTNADEDGSGTVTADDTLTYTLEGENTGLGDPGPT